VVSLIDSSKQLAKLTSGSDALNAFHHCLQPHNDIQSRNGSSHLAEFLTRQALGDRAVDRPRGGATTDYQAQPGDRKLIGPHEHLKPATLQVSGKPSRILPGRVEPRVPRQAGGF